ncbi:MAG: carboxypeptidase-like regulatory domain-containing protein [Saprospiraceae bacterium]
MKLKVDFLSRGLLTLILAIAVSSFTFAQRTITGTITDADNGEPLISATVLEAGTSNGTITDFDGNYSLAVSAGATQLEISYTGYGTQTIDIGNLSVVDATLAAGTILD